MFYAKTNKVTVYSTSTCPYCDMAKQYLRNKGVAYEEVDVASDRERAMEMVQKSGQRGVPVLDINGQVVLGFNPTAIDMALGY